MKNLDHVKIEQEEKRAAIKSIDEHEWSDDDIEKVTLSEPVTDNGYGERLEPVLLIHIDGFHKRFICIESQDLAVLANAKSFDLVKREEG